MNHQTKVTSYYEIKGKLSGLCWAGLAVTATIKEARKLSKEFNKINWDTQIEKVEIYRKIVT